jgi:diaminopimelate decarboxylase
MTCFPVPGFHYSHGVMHADGVSLTALAQRYGTPLYVYSALGLDAAWDAYATAFAGQNMQICYALKANPNLSVIRHLARRGAGADVVSWGEMQRAMAAGIPADRIIFSGVGKTYEELTAALAAGIHQINAESVNELEAISAAAQALGVIAPVALRINPDIDAQTHGKIATGRREDKFGIDIAHAPEAMAKAMRLPGLQPVGLAVHIGSQLTTLAPFQRAFRKTLSLAQSLRVQGVPLRRLDLGGGLGVPYHLNDPAPNHAAYAAMVAETVGGHGFVLSLEPGRSLVAAAGLLLSRTLYVKEGAQRRFLILDAAMNDLMRPALYDAWHEAIPVRAFSPDAALAPVDLVGPVCETGDTFARQRPMPPVAEGDLVAFMTAGAYGASMSSSYNSRPLIAEVMTKDGQAALIRRRPDFAASIALEESPPWQSGGAA